ncbi:astacin, partial [Ostertagia ostertagi]
KFQGDIAGIDAALLREPDGMVFYNALKNKQLAWKDGIIPYEMDPAFYRDDHIHIRWDNILPGMKSQFDKISAALQDTQGEKYDYRSIMHYDSTAFSRNGKNTIETVVDGFTDVIGSSVDLSELDIIKINKLYQCSSSRNEQSKTSTTTQSSHKGSELLGDIAAGPHYVNIDLSNLINIEFEKSLELFFN